MSIKLSVIIGSFNQCEVLKKVLPHYEHQNCPKEKFEVIVVDSTSTDGAVDFLKKYNPAFNFTAHIQDNAGKAIARNNGVSLAKGEIVLITDADMIPDPGLVQAHIDAHNAQETPCCFEGLAWNMKTLNWPDNQDEWTAQVGTDPKQLKKLGWYYFLTGNLSMPKSVFIEENGFNTQFLGYGWEDLELGYRLQKKGILLRYLKTGINYHYHVISEDDEIQRNEKKRRVSQNHVAITSGTKDISRVKPLIPMAISKNSRTRPILSMDENTMVSVKK